MTPDPTPSLGPDPYGNPDPEPRWLGIDWREHLRTTDVGGTQINYVELGDGPDPLLFVHGLSGSWQNWLEQVPHFADSRRVLALDLPGFGDSPMPSWEITIEAYGDLLHDFCDVTGVESCAVVGNSMGGFIAAEAVARDQRRFDRHGPRLGRRRLARARCEPSRPRRWAGSPPRRRRWG